MSRVWLNRQGFLVTLQSIDIQALLNMGRNNSDWATTPLASNIKEILGESDREEILPHPVPSLVMGSEEKIMRTISFATAGLILLL